jgi:hypothetical protein
MGVLRSYEIKILQIKEYKHRRPDKALAPIFDSIRIFQRRHPALCCRISLTLIRPTGSSCTIKISVCIRVHQWFK